MTLIAILVALGLQTVLEAIIPASVANLEFGWPDKTVIYHAGQHYWLAESIVRFVGFFVGGYVGGRMVVAMRRRVSVLLAVAAVVVTLFQQLPGPGPLSLWVLWAFAAPVAIVAGAYVARARRHVSPP
ncbi:hypothetical protein [Piscinibacter terrae]|nr:hypothetical protein [Albitalea terrae]